MSKKINNNIYHFEDYIQIEKLSCVLKMRFNNDELTLWAEKIKSLHAIKAKWGIRIYCQVSIFTLFTQREGKGIMFKK